MSRECWSYSRLFTLAGQRIEVEMHCRKGNIPHFCNKSWIVNHVLPIGRGKDHAKFSPCATASYRLLPGNPTSAASRCPTPPDYNSLSLDAAIHVPSWLGAAAVCVEQISCSPSPSLGNSRTNSRWAEGRGIINSVVWWGRVKYVWGTCLTNQLISVYRISSVLPGWMDGWLCICRRECVHCGSSTSRTSMAFPRLWPLDPGTAPCAGEDLSPYLTPHLSGN